MILTILFGGVVTASHAWQLRKAQAMTDASYDERDRLWRRHQALNGTLWMLLFLAIVAAQFFFSHGDRKTMPLLGIVLLAFGFILVVWSRLILGRSGAMGLRWFLPEKISAWETRGPYRMLTNPMYDGFILIFLGLGFAAGTTENFYLALASFLLLNVYLATVESRGQRNKIF